MSRYRSLLSLIDKTTPYLNQARKTLLSEPAGYISKRYSTNVDNFIKGFYSGPVAKAKGATGAFVKAIPTTTLQAVMPNLSKAYREIGISKNTYNISRDAIKNINEAAKAAGDGIKAQPEVIRFAQNKLHHQLMHNYGLNIKYGGKLEGLDPYIKRHAVLKGDGAALLPGNLKKIKDMGIYTEKEIKRRIDDVLETWSMTKDGKPISFLELFPTRFHQSHRDIQMWNPKAIDFFIEAKQAVDRGGKGGFINYFKKSQIEDVGKFLQVNTSPNLKSNYYLGGFNGKILFNKKTHELELLPTDVLDLGGSGMLGKMISMVAERGAKQRVMNYMRTKAIKIPDIKRLRAKKTEVKKKKYDFDTEAKRYDEYGLSRKMTDVGTTSNRLDYRGLRDTIGGQLKWTKADIDAINNMMDVYEGVTMRGSKDWARYLGPRTFVASAPVYYGYNWLDD